MERPAMRTLGITLAAALGALAALGAGACGLLGSARSPDLGAALDSIDPEGLMAHVRALSADELEGRAPGTRGEELTVQYLVGRLREMGLAPGNPDGSWVQEVPLVGFRAVPELALQAGGERLEPSFPEQFVAVSRLARAEVLVSDSAVVFVGYGVVAPEYGWDDFKDVDVRGKTLLMLVNDPQIADPRDPAQLDERAFKGRAMTYYGRWTYKYEIAAAKGAAAAILVHETGPAGYPWEVVSGSWGRENFDIEGAREDEPRLSVESWISRPTAERLLSAAGHDLEELKRSALEREFRPVETGARASFRVANEVRRVRSRNVLGKVPGGELAEECILYTAHWDHLGTDPALSGDTIFNGALDNASGCAALLEIAQAFRALDAPPRRTVVFLFTTAEEKGLLGSRYYAENPLYPLERTLANVNIDGVNPWGRTRDVISVGHGNTTLDDLLAQLAREQNRVVRPDAEPEKGYYYRSDHFELAKRGVPALDPDMGTEFIGRPPGWGAQKRAEYNALRYHKPADEIQPDWDLSGAAEDARLYFLLGYRVAEGERWPEWKPGTEFAARREAMLQAARR
ncbi:MAG TPA: M20/M25/M40 family metallo-hydrolase [Planctomycetota bacterium]|nr:M20/M25/M40 family metallo-hydrolase [Planctomycetota bacterium]